MDFPISRCSKKTTSITQFLKNRTDCVWVINKQLSSGAQGQIFKVCCGNEDLECKYVMKSAQNNGENEIKMHNLFYKLGLAPKIVEAFICNEEVGKSRSGLPIFDYETYIVMEKKDFNAKDYIFYLSKHGAPKDFVLAAIQELMYQTFQAIVKANSNRLWHNDKIIENIMLDFNPNGTFRDLVFIDFSFSKVANSPKEAKEKESYNELVMTFRLLLKNYLTLIEDLDNIDNYWEIMTKNVLHRLGVQDWDEIRLIKPELKEIDYLYKDLDISNNIVVREEDDIDIEEIDDGFKPGFLSFEDDEEMFSTPPSTPPATPKKGKAPPEVKHRFSGYKIEEIFY